MEFPQFIDFCHSSWLTIGMNQLSSDQKCNLHNQNQRLASQLAIYEEVSIADAEVIAQLRLALCRAIQLHPTLKDHAFIADALASAVRLMGDIDEMLEENFG